MVSASEAIKDSYEHDCGPLVGKKASDIGYSLLSSLQSFAQEATDNAQILGDCLRSNNLAHRSLERDAPAPLGFK